MLIKYIGAALVFRLLRLYGLRYAALLFIYGLVTVLIDCLDYFAVKRFRITQLDRVI